MNWFEPQSRGDLAIPFAMDVAGHWRDVSEVERGLSCACSCPSCKGPVVAKKGDQRTHHFAHHDRRECRHALESSLFGMATQLLAAPGARLALPGHMMRRHLAQEFGAHLGSKQEADFFRKVWVIDPGCIIMPDGFQLHACSLTESKVDRADFSAPEHKLAVHFLSHLKNRDDVSRAPVEPGWRVLAINLSYYVSLWWDTCDEEKDAKVSEAKAARGKMRRWLGEQDTGRGFLHHPEYSEKKEIFRTWLQSKQAERREVERLEQERRLVAERAMNAPWVIPKVNGMPEGALLYRTILLEQRQRLTNWLAREIGLRVYPGNDAWVFVGAPGEIVPAIARKYLDTSIPWRVFPSAVEADQAANSATKTPSKGHEQSDEILTPRVATCVICGSAVDEVLLGSGLFAGRRARQCSTNRSHPLAMVPRSPSE
jgi:hypothetical protein